MTEVSAQGGTGSGQNYAQAYGIKNTFSALETGDETAVNTLVVRAVGGKATADTANVAAEAYGLVNEDAGRASLLGSWILDVRSTGGSAVDGVTPAYTTADAVGINNQSTNGVEINGPVTITVTADGGADARGWPTSLMKSRGIALPCPCSIRVPTTKLSGTMRRGCPRDCD